MEAREYVKSLMADVGLEVREDAMGNIFGKWQGSDSSLGSILTGSHCDAIPLAGMYDGTLGVIGAIEALAALKRAGFQPKGSLEVMMFTSEEPTRFKLSCIGSRAMAAALEAETLDVKLDENGTSFMEAANSVGYGGSSHQAIIEATKVPKGAVDFFVELHIEQGPLLEKEGINIGVVTAIAAPAALEVQFFGDGGHAGAQLMPYSVPREARLGIDVRDIDGERRNFVVQSIIESAKSIADNRNVQQAIKDAADALKLSTKYMVSRAYHDSLFMARVAPTGMIFIPCRGGYSHRPDEFASEEDIRNGVGVLALTMAKLSGGQWLPEAAEEQQLKEEL
eukprot:gene7869-8065_t